MSVNEEITTYIRKLRNKRKYVPKDEATITTNLRNGPILKGQEFRSIVVDCSNSRSPNQLPPFQFNATGFEDAFRKLEKALCNYFGETGADPLFVW